MLKIIREALEGHEGIMWEGVEGHWTCRCGQGLTPPMTPARPAEALSPWRSHVALLLTSVYANRPDCPRSGSRE